jgi:dynein heavy chain
MLLLLISCCAHARAHHRQVLFRPVVMMTPDYGLIAEVTLLSQGFSRAGWLARKMVRLYALAAQQLSAQPHYDWGLRALKVALLTAGTIKRACMELAEAHVALRALREANLPKLLTEVRRCWPPHA